MHRDCVDPRQSCAAQRSLALGNSVPRARGSRRADNRTRTPSADPDPRAICRSEETPDEPRLYSLPIRLRRVARGGVAAFIAAVQMNPTGLAPTVHCAYGVNSKMAGLAVARSGASATNVINYCRDFQKRRPRDWLVATITIDPGHGGSEPIGGSSPNNATAPAGGLEKAFALTAGLAARDAALGLGHEVVLTRSTDLNIGLSDRAAVAKQRRAPVFVSIHFNASSGPPAQGTETLVHFSRTAGSDRLASCLQNAIVAATGYRDRGVRPQTLGVLNSANHDPATAAALVEVSFIDRQPDEERRLNDPVYVREIGAALAAGVDKFLRDETFWGATRYTPRASILATIRALFFDSPDTDG